MMSFYRPTNTACTMRMCTLSSIPSNPSFYLFLFLPPSHSPMFLLLFRALVTFRPKNSTDPRDVLVPATTPPSLARLPIAVRDHNTTASTRITSATLQQSAVNIVVSEVTQQQAGGLKLSALLRNDTGSVSLVSPTVRTVHSVSGLVDSFERSATLKKNAHLMQLQHAVEDLQHQFQSARLDDLKKSMADEQTRLAALENATFTRDKFNTVTNEEFNKVKQDIDAQLLNLEAKLYKLKVLIPS